MKKRSEIMVSICCITYNQENYIKDAIEGFLSQKTNFKYEVIIHDDASSDNTAKIIEEYVQKYPGIIKPIYQKENQQSKGKRPSFITYEKAQGKYIALCEGDDYWIDENKLQTQYDYMENHAECCACLHSAMKVNYDKTAISPVQPYKNNTDINIKEYCYKQDSYPTASLFFKKENVNAPIPDFLQKAPVGDIPLSLWFLTKGYMHYEDKVMSCYRVNVPNSWSNTAFKDKAKIKEHDQKMELMYDLYNKYTNYKHNKLIHMEKAKRVLNLCKNKNDIKRVKTEYKLGYKALPLDLKIKKYIKVSFPKLFDIYNKIRNR